MIKKGEFAYNKSYSKGFPWGTIKRLNRYNMGVLSTLYIIFKPTNVDSNFLEKYYDTNYWHKEISMIATEGARNHGLLNIAPSDFFDSKLIIPVDKTEQYKVGNILKKLDELIDLYQNQLLMYESLKKYLLQNLFPSDEEKVPNVRFADFSGDWGKRKFSELYEKMIEKNDLSFNSSQIISVANMYYKSGQNTNSTEEYMKTYNIFLKGDIAYEGHKSKNFSYGRFVENDIGNGIVSHVFDVFRPKAKYDLYFWKYLINNENIMGYILRKVTTKATMMNNLVAKDFLKQKIKTPDYKEQENIGALLKQLDNFTELQEDRLLILKKTKKYYLQKLFI
ncbi:restriction endonuclease subunit S [Companilactobacillus heilongjiangensis]|uniref:restriction endonuclease subunit S n=1 Tax=Companilactobacillus heilongjiangensis TaxID=1074467 RepID=UPI00069E87B8|nr:restriction endonuclease subunit S [Companilactobacillus heilongjiangensis]